MLECGSSMNEDVERLKNNIQKLEDRISILQDNGQDQNVINVLNREKFNQQRLINMVEAPYEEPRPLCLDVLLSEIYDKHRGRIYVDSVKS